MIRLIGACSGLLAFSIAILQGLAVGNPPIVVLGRAIWAMVLFFMLGSVLGWMAHGIVVEHAAAKQEEVSAPYRDQPESPGEDSVSEVPAGTEENSTRPDSRPIAT